MKKDEILEKIRQTNLDEGMKYAENSENKLGGIVVLILGILLLIFSMLFKSSVFYAFSAIIFTYLAIDGFKKYRSSGMKLVLLSFILNSIISINSIVVFILTILKNAQDV